LKLSDTTLNNSRLDCDTITHSFFVTAHAANFQRIFKRKSGCSLRRIRFSASYPLKAGTGREQLPFFLHHFPTAHHWPNAGHQARREAGATQERTLYAVACMPMLGCSNLLAIQ
jgi:hypothetical protein